MAALPAETVEGQGEQTVAEEMEEDARKGYDGVENGNAQLPKQTRTVGQPGVV